MKLGYSLFPLELDGGETHFVVWGSIQPMWVFCELLQVGHVSAIDDQAQRVQYLLHTHTTCSC